MVLHNLIVIVALLVTVPPALSRPANPIKGRDGTGGPATKEPGHAQQLLNGMEEEVKLQQERMKLRMKNDERKRAARVPTELMRMNEMMHEQMDGLSTELELESMNETEKQYALVWKELYQMLKDGYIPSSSNNPLTGVAVACLDRLTWWSAEEWKQDLEQQKNNIEHRRRNRALTEISNWIIEYNRNTINGWKSANQMNRVSATDDLQKQM